ncbi:hypothetical protein GCM10027404_13220 [Arthrobacter tumbae]|uniref:CHRD domain-containing protein n=1 Tax=Arthrobacter tumbae TaxID=163874 RepID=UPI001958FA65|nr:CHRD domain-containing protein [Arthrobacter tumbae]MBM7782604.1 hypothetical protein [Arthrobacter tumbae]
MRTRNSSRIAALTGTAGAVALLATMGAAPASAETTVERPDTFTSYHTVYATPDQVVGQDGNPAPGEPGATGGFDFMINSDLEIICYDITLNGVTPPYQSAAKTATHIHETVAGENGPPRLAFPNPEGDGVLTSSGCIQGPFTTGIEGDDGADTGEGFSLKEIEANPAGFSADTHTSAYVPGAVRGQLTPMPVGGADTGVAVIPDEGSNAALPLALGILGAATLGAVVVTRSRTKLG